MATALDKVVRLLWYSPAYKDRQLANELSEEFAKMQKRIDELEKKLQKKAPAK